MRVLGISPLEIWTMGRGAGMPSVYRTLLGYARAGHEVHYLIGGAEAGEAQVDGVHVHRFRVPFRGATRGNRLIVGMSTYFRWTLFQLCGLLPALRLMRKYRPDVVYGHTSYGVPLAGLLARLYHCPWVYREYGTLFLAKYLDAPLQLALRAYDLVGFRWPADLLILTNDGSESDRIARRFRVPPERVCFWFNGVDSFPVCGQQELEQLRQRLGANEEDRLLLMVGRLVSSKGVDRLLRALPEILAAHPDVLAVICGEGELRGELEELAAYLGVQDRVRLVGPVPRDQLGAYYQLADIFLALNRGSNLGNPLIEALKAGKCIVTLDNDGTKQVVTNGQTGVLLSEENLGSLGSVVIRLLDDPAERQRLAEGARRFAEEHFLSWDDRVAGEIETVESLVASRAGLRR